MDTVHLESCPKCGGDPCVNAHTNPKTFRLDWCIGCVECGFHGTEHQSAETEEDNKADLILAAEEWNSMCKGEESP